MAIECQPIATQKTLVRIGETRAKALLMLTLQFCKDVEAVLPDDVIQQLLDRQRPHDAELLTTKHQSPLET
jgi:hypothetical protein